jgi:hypothetical protein
VIADVGAEGLKDTGRGMTERKSRDRRQMNFVKAPWIIYQRAG